MQEEEILECLLQDASEGIRLAIEEYGGAVKTICCAILSGYKSEDIEEAVSDSFVALWRNREKIQIEDGSGLKPYLYGIARRTALNKKRSLAKQQTTENIDEYEKASEENLEESVVQKEENRFLYQLVMAMKSPDREIFIYRYFEQNSVKEIADRIHLKAKTVENKLTRGRAKLKKQLIQCGISL